MGELGGECAGENEGGDDCGVWAGELVYILSVGGGGLSECV